MASGPSEASTRSSPEDGPPTATTPKSGRGAGLSRATALRTALGNANHVEVLQTKSRGHASEAVAERAGSFERVVAIGGDGTLNEVLTGLFRAGGSADQLPALRRCSGRRQIVGNFV